MPVLVSIVLHPLTQPEYDAVRRECGWLERRPDGGYAHLTWWDGTTCHNLDVWESAEAYAAFIETRLAPAMAAAGVSVEPQVNFLDAYEVYLPTTMTVTATPV